MWAESNIPLYHLLSKNIPIFCRWKDKSKPRFYFLSSVLNQTALGRETHSLEDWKRNVLGMHVSGFWFPVKWAVMSRLGMRLKIIRTASPLANLVTFPWVTFQIGKSVIHTRKTTDLELDILVSHWLHNASIKTNKQKKAGDYLNWGFFSFRKDPIVCACYIWPPDHFVRLGLGESVNLG